MDAVIAFCIGFIAVFCICALAIVAILIFIGMRDARRQKQDCRPARRVVHLPHRYLIDREGR